MTKIAGLVGAGMLLVCFSVQTLAQRPRRTTSGKTASRTPSNSLTNPSSNDPRQLLVDAQASQNAGRFDEAIRTYNRVIAISASQPQTAALANLGLGNTYMVQRKFENAIGAYQRAVKLNPSDAEAHNNLGEALGELKQYPRAIQAFNIAVDLNPKLIKARYNQAVSYDRMGNFRYAEFVFRNVIKIKPDYSLAYDGLAVTLAKDGRAKDAIVFHEKAVALDPSDPSYYYNLAISYLILGNTAKAVEQQEKLKTISPAIADRLASVIVKRQM